MIEGLQSPTYAVYGVTGNPILHSKSPVMFNMVFNQQPYRFGANFHYIRVAASSAEEAVYLCRELVLQGMNVTAPFKQSMLSCLDMVETSAVSIGGVNTVYVKDHGLIGTNTDYNGVVESLKRRNIAVRGREFIILGAGGAGRAAAYGLVREGGKVIILNRTYAKATSAAENTGSRAEDFSTLHSLLQTADCLISTLPGNVDLVDADWLRPELTVFDADYKHSSLIPKARARGCTVITGEEWLVNQALPAFEYFMGFHAGADTAELMRLAVALPAPPLPKNIALIGFMAGGKSAVGKLLAQKSGMRFIDLDACVEEAEGCSIPDIFKQKGESYFREREKDILKKELEIADNTVFACGGGAVLDEDSKAVLKQNALTVWLYASIEETLKRLQPGTRPLLDSPNPETAARQLLQRRLIHYARASDLVVCSENGADGTAEKIYDEINKTFSH